MGDLGSIPGLGGSPGEGKGYPLQYSGLENSMDCIIHGEQCLFSRTNSISQPVDLLLLSPRAVSTESLCALVRLEIAAD